MTSPTRLLIVARHPAVRAGTRTIFQLAECIEVIGEAAGPAEALQEALRLRPDVALIDLDPPGESEDRLSLIAQIKALALGIRVAALTAHDYPAARQRASASGADAVIIKGADLNEMLQIIQDLKEKPK